MNKYQVYFEGGLFVYAESEDEAIQKADAGLDFDLYFDNEPTDMMS